MIVEHIKTGNLYEVISMDAMMKHPDTGEWVNAVVYTRVWEPTIYCRTLSSFKISFESEGSHNTGDPVHDD